MITGEFECLQCHETFECEITYDQIDDAQECPNCHGLGELQIEIIEREHETC